MKPETYIFRIDRFTPATLPMARLAQYLTELSALLGESERVHFKQLRHGSASVVACVEPVAVPKVLARMNRVASADLGDEVRKHFDELNVMLARDNASAAIKRKSAVILRFPGRDLPPRIGPFTQQTELHGQLVRIGGRDKTAHATLEDADGRVWHVILTRDEAKKLGPLIYGAIIRVSGPGRWTRNEAGQWELESMKLQTWEPLDAVTLREGVTAIRRIPGSEWPAEADPASVLTKIRHGDEEEIH